MKKRTKKLRLPLSFCLVTQRIMKKRKASWETAVEVQEIKEFLTEDKLAFPKIPTITSSLLLPWTNLGRNIDRYGKAPPERKEYLLRLQVYERLEISPGSSVMKG